MENKRQKITRWWGALAFVFCLLGFLFYGKGNVYAVCYCACGCTLAGDCKTCTGVGGSTVILSTYCSSSNKRDCICGCKATIDGGACKSCCLASKCPYGCTVNSDTGGVCKTQPTPTPTPVCPAGVASDGKCLPYCAASNNCFCGCDPLSSSGGTCKSPCPVSYCQIASECTYACGGSSSSVCTASCEGGKCVATMNEPTTNCSAYPTGWTTTRSCGGECVNCKLYKWETCDNSLRITVCGSCGGAACGLCDGTAPSAPRAVAPSGVDLMTQITTLSWEKPTNWGTVCGTGGTRGYQVCVESSLNTGATCTGNTFNISGENTLSYDYQNQYNGPNYWKVRAVNEDGLYSAWSALNYCFTGITIDEGYPFSVSAWSACNPATHTRTRTCLVGCICEGVPLEEECKGVISGTFFNATGLSACPGDLTNIEKIGGVFFELVDGDSNPAPSVADTSNALGNFSTEVLAPGVYSFDFREMSGYDPSPGAILACNGTVASVAGSDPTCATQPCNFVQNMNFGLLEKYTGWWQVKGGSVYGQNGVQSIIPSSFGGLELSKQRLILPDDVSGRNGLLVYGQKINGQLGGNENAIVSGDLWEIQSSYETLRYDYDFYEVRTDIFGATPWDGGDINYDDGGVGYQIFKYTGTENIDAFNYSGPTGTQKVILLIDANVNVIGNIEVPEGAFLAIISSGSIDFNYNVTKAQGWFIGENINIPCKDITEDGCDMEDEQFLGEGSFVAWTNMFLSRTLAGSLNNTQPSELFTYRPDFMVNIPTPMKVYTKKFSPFIP